jgi:sulfite reductase (ferredoxin)
MEMRLRLGCYGQRQEGVQMQRIKIPLGILSTSQMEVLAEVAEAYAVGILHVTTRQDFQMHFIDINDSPSLMRRLAEAGITTREACGNTVRNVCACPNAGVCGDELFDVTPYARAMAYFLLRHPDAQNFGRKFKIAFSGCAHQGCGLALMHDMGAVAQVRATNGHSERGFAVYVGGGLGAVPHRAKLYCEFVPAGEMLPLAQAISRVFARLGEKRNRARARIKFLVANLGIEEFRRLVDEERGKLRDDPRWTDWLDEAEGFAERPAHAGSQLELAGTSQRFQRWLRLNTQPQRQAGYHSATVFLPLGDITSEQARGLARLCRRLAGDNTVRTTVEQNLLVRWLPSGALPEFYEGLVALKLEQVGAGRLADVTACPGTDSCKLGISSSRGLAAVLHEKLQEGDFADLAERSDLRVKISGCFNACAQHHVGDIGFFGSVKRKGAYTAPVFQVVLGGSMAGNGQSFGLGVARVATKRAPEVIRKLADHYTANRNEGETFAAYATRLGKAAVKALLAEFEDIPDYYAAPEFYKDNRQSWDYALSTGVGECAGEVVDQAEFMLEDADRLHFQASLQLESGNLAAAGDLAFAAMRKAADGLLSTKGLLLSDGYDTVAEFRRHFSGNGTFYQPFCEYFFRTAERGSAGLDHDTSTQRIEEARLFIEEAEGYYSRLGSVKPTKVASPTIAAGI